ncbi:MAG: TLD domain-containing protein, partial [Mycobacteriaceae bacterium]|nr:TLD domain-containing protein [Mycobacteriaceae bacterium]
LLPKATDVTKFSDSSYHLLYRASRDGKDSASFHRLCDHKGPTVTIIKDSSGNVFGGYTSASWNETGDYYSDPSAFLFTLHNPHNLPPTKYPKTTNNTLAIYCASNYGPTFGAGHDIYVDNGHTSSCYVRFPHSFADSTGKGSTTFTSQTSFLPAEVEVWQCPSEDFGNSAILDTALSVALKQLILPLPPHVHTSAHTPSITLLYRASRDGRDASSFHRLCDNQGPTITLIKDEQGNVFGGFAALSWHSNNTYSDDRSSFLFTLRNPRSSGSEAMKFVRNLSVSHGIYGAVGYGPTFGGGHDIYIDDGHSEQGSYVAFPYSYVDSSGLGGAVFTGGRTFTAVEVEVFRV